MGGIVVEKFVIVFNSTLCSVVTVAAVVVTAIAVVVTVTIIVVVVDEV